VPDAFIDRVFAVMALCSQHTFQILTKRAERMRAYVQHLEERLGAVWDLTNQPTWIELPAGRSFPRFPDNWPLPNVWLGVSVENQHLADERIPLLLQTPAAVRFISAEPLLGPVDLRFLQPSDPPVEIDAMNGTHGVLRPHGSTNTRLDWVMIVGGESGPGARPCALEWIESIVAQCRAAAIPVFVKQLGAYVVSEHRTCDPQMFRHPEKALIAPSGEAWAWRAGLSDKKGGDFSEFPPELRLRDFPVMDAITRLVASAELPDPEVEA
jgi:protein gp37